MCREYAETDQPFGIDAQSVVELTDLDAADATALVDPFRPNKEGFVNVVTFLSAIIILCDGDNKDCLLERIGLLFSLMDFTSAGVISRDDAVTFICDAHTKCASFNNQCFVYRYRLCCYCLYGLLY